MVLQEDSYEEGADVKIPQSVKFQLPSVDDDLLPDATEFQQLVGSL